MQIRDDGGLRAGALALAVAIVGALALAWPGVAPATAGTIVADSGFRPDPDGFSFPNYGDEEGYANLNARELERMFGPRVCASRKQGRCVLKPGARAWMRSQNEAMAGGHCYGFAVLSELIDKGQIKRFGYSSLAAFGGGPETFDLAIEGNTRLQRSIARAWAFQSYASVARGTIAGKPSEVLDVLIRDLRADEPESWTFAIFQRGFKGGHAITPYAVEDMGGGVYDVHVYDNNWPDDAERRLTIDTNAETWRYYAATRPDLPGAEYEGDATTDTLRLMPTQPALGVQPCAFCGRKGLHAKHNEITLNAGGEEHAHLLFRDGAGRRTGFAGGEPVNEIPGAKVLPRSSGGPQFRADGELESYADSLEPVYQLPRATAFRLRVDGRHLTKTDRQELTVVGPTFDATVAGLRVAPGESARLRLEPRREVLRYAPAPAGKGTARVAFGAESKQASFQIRVVAKKLRAGKAVRFRKIADRGLLRIGDNSAGKQRYKVAIDVFARQGQGRIARSFALGGAKRAYLYYGGLAGRGEPAVVITNKAGFILRELELR